MLYLIATPIGNLSDITLRAIEILKSCDYILCEDTRHSLHLLKHYQIHKPLHSFHQFNEKKKEDSILSDLKGGQTIAVISDAGTPGICDPGEKLVHRCRELKIPVSAIPGPCAWVMALSLSTMDRKRSQFVGFVDPKELPYLLSYPGTTIGYEAPHRIINTLKALNQLDPLRKICIQRELTKTFEECLEGTAVELLTHFQQTTPRGEMVILIEGYIVPPGDLQEVEHVHLIHNKFGISIADAIKVTAELRGVPKREVYNKFHTTLDES